MNYLQNKLAKKIPYTILCAMMLLQLVVLNIPTALAAELSCEDSKDPAKNKGYVVTTLEEQIGEPKSDSGESVINCFRETKCTTVTDDKGTKSQECKSEVKTSCSISADTQCKRIQIIFAKSGAGLLYSYIQRIYVWAASTIGIVAVFFIVLGGIEMSTAQADSGKIEKAKERIMQSLGGLVILFLSALILYTINPNFFTQ